MTGSLVRNAVNLLPGVKLGKVCRPAGLGSDGDPAMAQVLAVARVATRQAPMLETGMEIDR
jgi:hypothetical protein